MRKNKSYSYRSGSDRTFVGSMIRGFFLLAILGAVGGVTWLALTPVNPTVQQTVRPVPADKLGGTT